MRRGLSSKRTQVRIPVEELFLLNKSYKIHKPLHDKCKFNLYTSTIFIKCIHISEHKTTIKKQFLALLRV